MKMLPLIFGLLLAGCTQSPESVLGDTPANAIEVNPSLKPVAMKLGEQVFDANCASCHGSDMKGAPGQHASNLVDDHWLHTGTDLDRFIMTAADVENTVQYGIRSKHPKTVDSVDMPARGMSKVMDAGEINDVVDYVWFLNGSKINPATKARGLEMFNGEGACYDCHAPDALGNSAVGAPSLKRPETWLWGHDKAALQATVTNGHAGNSCPAFVGKLKPVEIRSVAVYVLNKSAARTF
jgi:cytochrome c oxidase cbb3-type subunit III